MALSNGPARATPTTVYGIDPATWRQFRAYCVAEGLTTGDEVTRALREYLERQQSALSASRA